MAPKLTPQERIVLVKRVIEGGEPVAKVCREVGISRVLFYKWLRRFKEEGRKALEPRRAGRRRLVPSKIFKKVIHLSPRKRLEMFEEVLEKGEPVSKIAREYGISRTLFYRLLKRYKEAPEEERLEALEPKKAYIERYFRQTPERFERSVLALVVKHPEFGVRRLVANLPRVAGVPIVGHHGVQNILWRAGLSTYEARAAFAAAQVTPVTRLIGEVTSYLSRFIALPVEVRTQVIRFAGITFVSAFLTIVILGIGGFWLTVVSGVPLAARVGLVFASTALLMGSLFFLYSMKYYFTLAIVLSFSQQAGGIVNSNQQLVNSNGKNGPSASSGFNRRNGFLSWILGFGNGINGGSSLPRAQRGVGLEPSLEHVTLKRKPFISVHIPFYNEKNVAERILAAVTAFDWANYEVIVVDDSTDETTGIAKQFLKVNYGELRIIKDDEGTEIYKTPIINPNNPSSTLKNLPTITLIHRTSRAGFKGGALGEALKHTDKRAEFIVVFDADFVPYPDTLELFLKYFQVTAGSLDFKKVTSDQWLVTSEGKQNKPTNHQLPITNHSSNIAAVQGYQWHVLNKSENWVTRGVRSEYSGSYVIERSGTEILGALKMIAGSVYMVRRDLLEKFGWGTSITEDFQLTLRLYEAGYKVVYTPYIQAPAECVSTLKRLVRQRMRWAEGHSHNIRKMFVRLLFGDWKTDDGGQKTETEDRKQMTENHPSVIGLQNPSSAFSLQSSKSQSSRTWVPSPLTLMEKLEFLYLSPYYLQAFFFLVGTLSWLLAETLFPARLPFWTSLWGWSLVLTNFLSLPLMNAVGMFLEEAEERDYLGIISFLALSYILVPFQAYASLKGFLEKQEGPWFRTPKTGKITDIFTRGRFYRLIAGILPGRAPAVAHARVFNFQFPIFNKLTNHQPLITNHYLSLATANNRFNSFSILPRRKRWIGKTGVALVVLLALFVNYLGFFVQTSQAAAPGGQWWDNNYQYRQKVTVTSGANSPSGGYNGYTARVSNWDTTGLVTGGKMQNDCDDLRVAWWNGTGWTELVRHVIGCNTTATDVRFKLQADIAASSSDDNYYIYYGYSLATAPTALGTTNVYLWWDDASVSNIASYTIGRGDTWHGTSGYTGFAWNVGGYYTYDTGDNFTGSMRRAVAERDVFIESEFYHTNAYPNDMTSGLTARFILASGTGATELADHYYASNRADSTFQASAAYAHDRDIMKTARGTVAIDGTIGAVTTGNQWRKQALAIWLINSTNGKFWDNDTAASMGPVGWPSQTVTTSGTDATDYEGAGDAGFIIAQDAARLRNILIRRYVEPEPTTARSTEEVVPEVVLLLLPLAILLPFILKRRFVPVSVPIRP